MNKPLDEATNPTIAAPTAATPTVATNITTNSLLEGMSPTTTSADSVPSDDKDMMLGVDEAVGECPDTSDPKSVVPDDPYNPA